MDDVPAFIARYEKEKADNMKAFELETIDKVADDDDGGDE